MQLLDGQLFGWRETLITSSSFAACAVAIYATRWCPRLAGRSSDISAVQSAHSSITPRVGGLGIILTILLMAFYSPEGVKDRYLYLALASCFLFAAGFLEDLGFGVSPRMRLLAAAISSIAVIVLLDVWLDTIGVPYLDHLVSFWGIGIPLTLLVTVGLANGFNLIDGVNGLAGFTAITATVCLAYIARIAGYGDLSDLCIMLAAGIIGFWMLNFPFGMIFLGDAGAYVIGFVIGWFAISLAINVPEATPWAILLTIFWPVADTGLAIYRRSTRKTAKMRPDRLHVHQIVMRVLELTLLGRHRRSISNPMTTLVLAPFVLAPAVTGVLLWDRPLLAFLAVIVFTLLFFMSYLMTIPTVKRQLPSLDKCKSKRAAPIRNLEGPNA